jgi:hypothetical protein
MPHTDDFDQSDVAPDPIHDAARSANDLPDREVAELWDHPTGFRKDWDSFDGMKQAADESPGSDGILFRNVCEDLSQIESGGWRPRQSVSH